MPIFFGRPSTAKMQQFQQAQQQLSYSYPEQGTTAAKAFPKPYHHDRYRCYLGQGDDCWQAAKAALTHWQMFPKAWTIIYPKNVPQAVGQDVSVMIQLGPIYWLNGARVVYNYNEINRYGFAYGTLTSHAEKGEELFMLERNEKGEVFFVLEAFSLPQHPLAKLGAPFVRLLQKRFAKAAQAAIKEACP